LGLPTNPFRLPGLQPRQGTDAPKKKEDTPTVRRKATSETTSSTDAPPIVNEVLQSAGQPLNAETRAYFEPRFAHDFSGVRVHTDAKAAESARAVNANAYAVGRDIVFGAGRFDPAGLEGRRLIAHELTHVVQQGGTRLFLTEHAQSPVSSIHGISGLLQRQIPQTPSSPMPASSTTAVAQRQDYVFIMGTDTAGFYTLAESYFRAHYPAATFVTDLRNISDLLTHIATQIHSPIGNIYIVSHANEDGTLSFSLNASDTDEHLDVNELRTALHPTSGSSSLSQVTTQVDAQTRIHIKGCDIGRTRQMVELFDEAFGGAGTVTAPTHEQGYGTDPTLEQRAREEFHAEVEANHAMPQAVDSSAIDAAHPLPPAVDSQLRGAALRQARRERTRAARLVQQDRRAALMQARTQHTQALAQRQQDIQTEMTDRSGEADARAQRALTTESFSGPMFQRTGTQLYTAAELRPQIDSLYGHLSARQRTNIARELVAPDRRPASVQASQGTFNQTGQRLDRRTQYTLEFSDPQDQAEGVLIFGSQFPAGFRVENFNSTSGVAGLVITFSGTNSNSRQQRITMNIQIPSDAEIINRGKANLPNPDHYTWRIERHHERTGITTLRVIAERVIAYLHHRSLNASPHDHFIRPENDTNFFYTSTTPPP
jgi:hypothetical protein